MVARSVGWRGARAGLFFLGGVVLSPLVALIPPHAAWALASVVTGIVLGGRKWAERHTLFSLSGVCPRCGAAVQVEGPMRFRNGSTVDCASCHHGATLTVDAAALPAP